MSDHDNWQDIGGIGLLIECFANLIMLSGLDRIVLSPQDLPMRDDSRTCFGEQVGEQIGACMKESSGGNPTILVQRNTVLVLGTGVEETHNGGGRSILLFNGDQGGRSNTK
jgi:hypothetical protein